MAAGAQLRECSAAEAVIRRRIATRRERNAELAARAVQPLVWAELVRDIWREAPVLAKITTVPAALAAMPLLAPRAKLLLWVQRCAHWLAAAYRMWSHRAVDASPPDKRPDR